MVFADCFKNIMFINICILYTVLYCFYYCKEVEIRNMYQWNVKRYNAVLAMHFTLKALTSNTLL